MLWSNCYIVEAVNTKVMPSVDLSSVWSSASVIWHLFLQCQHMLKTYSSSRIHVCCNADERFSSSSWCFFPCDGSDPGASYCEEFLRQYTCWLLRSHSSQQPAKTLPEKHPQQPYASAHPWQDPSGPLPRTSTCESGTADNLTFHGQVCGGGGFAGSRRPHTKSLPPPGVVWSCASGRKLYRRNRK